MRTQTQVRRHLERGSARFQGDYAALLRCNFLSFLVKPCCEFQKMGMIAIRIVRSDLQILIGGPNHLGQRFLRDRVGSNLLTCAPNLTSDVDNTQICLFEIIKPLQLVGLA
jgi:hypothetical protein